MHPVLAWVSGGLIPTARRGLKLEGYVHGADWFKTITNLAGVTDDPDDTRASLVEHGSLPGIDSIDVWGYLTGKVDASPRTEIPLASFVADKAKGGGPGSNGSAALIVGDYKLVRFPQQYCFWMGPRYPNASTTHKDDKACNPCGATGCLYNIKTDEGEHHDLAATMPEMAAKLLARAQELDLTAIEVVMGAGWRGSNNKSLSCDDMHNYGGFWGPDLFP